VGQPAAGGALRDQRTVRELLLVLGAALALAGLAFGAAGLFFNRQVAVPDVAVEVEKGLRTVMRRQVALEGQVVESPAVIDAFATLVQRLAPGLGSQPFEPEVIVVDSPVVNAVTLPGGIVCVYTGLVRTLETADEMAAVLAHELAHVAHRDAFTLVARQVGMAALAAVVSGGSESVAQSILRSAVNARYTRAAEDRADGFALDLLEGSGLDPGAFGDALARLSALKDKPSELLRYLDTHSDIDERIEGARERSRLFTGARRPLGVDWRAVQAALPSAFDADG